MPVPLALAVPAAAASLAYLSARTSLAYDLRLLDGVATTSLRAAWREHRDRMNFFYVLEGYALSRSHASQTFVIYEGRRWTYRETYDTALRYGHWLRTRRGVKPREIVAMDFLNSPSLVFVWLGLWSIGAQPAFINYNLTGRPLVHCIKTSTARLVLVDEEVREAVAPVLDELTAPDLRDDGAPAEIVFFTPEVEADIAATESVRAPDAVRMGVRPQDMAILIFTSGTTGLPKAAIVSWAKVNFGSSFFFRWSGWRRRDVLYTCMPLYHSSAAILGFCATLSGGSTVAIGHRFSTKTFWAEVRAADATIIQYVGETCRYLLAAPPDLDPDTGEDLDRRNKVRLAVGNGLRPDVWNAFKERFGIETIGEFYAATEGTSGSWNLSRNDFARGAIGRNGLLGWALLGSTLAVVRVDWTSEEPWRDAKTGLCKKVATGAPGELLYKIDAGDVARKFQGYFRNDKATQGKVLRDVLKRGDAWFRTGDVVRWDGEGRWYFHDRIGDTFRWKSENVSTSKEVSEALGTHPCVQEANVYGVALPRHDGRAGMAAIVLSPSSHEPSLETLSSLAAHAKAHLPRYAVPLFLRFSAKSGPATGTNKQQKAELRAQGADPGKVGGDALYWLREGEYVPFEKRQWDEVRGGLVKL
ncbi:MAG: hypothetical protein M1832_004198 [Thelocarpon impressellum]|nr:MAG: hypothetical protein M1832_004198 [Thelocarpon impressellum]